MRMFVGRSHRVGIQRPISIPVRSPEWHTSTTRS